MNEQLEFHFISAMSSSSDGVWQSICIYLSSLSYLSYSASSISNSKFTAGACFLG
jgi:hypothetical protein